MGETYERSYRSHDDIEYPLLKWSTETLFSSFPCSSDSDWLASFSLLFLCSLLNFYFNDRKEPLPSEPPESELSIIYPESETLYHFPIGMISTCTSCTLTVVQAPKERLLAEGSAFPSGGAGAERKPLAFCRQGCSVSQADTVDYRLPA